MSYLADIRARKQAQIAAIVERGECRCLDHALVLLQQGAHLDRVNEFLSGRVQPLKPRTLDLQIYFVILSHRDRGLEPATIQYLEGLCQGHYGPTVPAYVSRDRSFDPWNYQLCNCPTENHLFNDAANELAATVVFPERVYNDGRTGAEYRPYWEDAFRRLVAGRVKYGMREWRSIVYFHVVLDDASMIYCLLPPGTTRDAARVVLDYLNLSLAISLRGRQWCGPHSRVYNHPGFTIYDIHHQIYGGWVSELRGQSFRGMTLASDYIVPEAIARLPDRQDRYLSREQLGPRYYPPGLGEGAYNPNRGNIFICQADREDWPGASILYARQTPTYVLGSVQDWGDYQGTWHMHCLPWSLTIAGDDATHQVLSFTGTGAEAREDQGGYMTWPSWNDQDATIFQHEQTLFCQMRGWNQRKFWEMLWDGGPDCPWPHGRAWPRLLGVRDEPVPRFSHFYLADSLGELVSEGGWLFAQKNGVGVAIRPVRGGWRDEPRTDWVPGRVFRCDVWDDVILVEVAELAEHEGFAGFRAKVLAAPLTWDAKEVQFTNLAGDRLVFRWKEDGDPTVNGVVPDYHGWRFLDPQVHGLAETGVIEILGEDTRCVLHAESPERVFREEWP